MEVKFYDSWDDMFDAEEKARKAADGRAKGWQQELEPGDYFLKDSGYGFPIFGKVCQRTL